MPRNCFWDCYWGGAGWRRSALTVPEAFTKANSAQFPSCHGAHASVPSFGSGINFAEIGSESHMFVRA